MSASLEDQIRSVQYLLIAKAGLAVSASSTMTLKDLQEEMLRVYGLLVQARLNEGKHNLTISQLWGASIAMHSARFTGDELWRRWKSIKTVITNVIIKTFHGCLGPGLKPPSGRTMEDMLEETKKRLWADKQDQLATDRLSAFLKKTARVCLFQQRSQHLSPTQQAGWARGSFWRSWSSARRRPAPPWPLT